MNSNIMPGTAKAMVNGKTMELMMKTNAENVHIRDGVTLADLLNNPSNTYNPNLLDNWYFVDPINQKGLLEYTASNYAGVISIDRWRLQHNGARLVLEPDGITLYAGKGGETEISQTVEKFKVMPNTTYTLSMACVKHDAVDIRISVYKYSSEGITSIAGDTLTFKTPSDYDGDLSICIYARGALQNAKLITIKAVKLEVGYTRTLTREDENGNQVLNDPAPNKHLELSKCMYYQQVISDYSKIIGVVRAWNANNAYFTIPLPSDMRIVNPSVLNQSTIGVMLSEIYVAYSTPIKSMTDIRVNNGIMSGYLSIENADFIPNTIYALAYAFGSATNRLIIDANL